MKQKIKRLKKTAEKTNSFRYQVTKFDKEGWANAKTASPIPFDLVTVLTSRRKKVPAWWDQQKWEGPRLRGCERVLKWRRRRYERIA